eukprot:scaffold72611_cov14-Tisochrysis_lutea.AAC.1
MTMQTEAEFYSWQLSTPNTATCTCLIALLPATTCSVAAAFNPQRCSLHLSGSPGCLQLPALLQLLHVPAACLVTSPAATPCRLNY